MRVNLFQYKTLSRSSPHHSQTFNVQRNISASLITAKGSVDYLYQVRERQAERRAHQASMECVSDSYRAYISLSRSRISLSY